ncbi:hypothetical protein Rpal_4898 [Rhodopseudomonas palustris TIE-1]|nr:hypothetical protein Rpal_4898 [Rhodopseudomonas palustris TIE-1]
MGKIHGKGPRDVFVRSYPRWRNGKRHTVLSGRRSNRLTTSLRRSKDQLDFGF